MTDETFDIGVDQAAALGARLTRAFTPRAVTTPAAATGPEPYEWKVRGGKAWVWLAPGHRALERPVIIADGFGAGASDLAEWRPLFRESGTDRHPWGSQLHDAGRDVIVLGYDSRNASIRTNADAAIECILRATAERSGSEPLVVGGLSMGGLVTRYALATLEMQRVDHQTRTYFSYDSPHRGAWIPLSLQVFAHFLAALGDLVADPVKKAQLKSLQQLINSDAARQLLWRHTATHLGVGPTFAADPLRTRFLDELAGLGSFPQRPRLLGVANGSGDGTGPAVTPGADNLVWPRKPGGPGATLLAQQDGADRLVATLHRIGGQGPVTVRTSGVPALDGAPGGTLSSFALAAAALKEAGYEATAAYPDVCFVPVASAVDLADPSRPYEPVSGMDPDGGGLTEIRVAGRNEGHTLLTSDLCTWLTERF
jgi:hypothetical protein